MFIGIARAKLTKRTFILASNFIYETKEMSSATACSYNEPVKVSLLYVNYNGLAHLGSLFEQSLQSILLTRGVKFEVVFVDNASSDGSLERARQLFRDDPRVKFLSLNENSGYTGAIQAGRNLVSDVSSYVGMLNSDLLFDENWLLRIVNLMDSEATIGGAQPSVVGRDGRAWRGGIFDLFGLNTFYKDPYLGATKEEIRETSVLAGAAMIFRKDLYDRIGGIDGRFFLWCEESDLSWRVLMSGMRNCVVLNSVVYHAESETTSLVDYRTKTFLQTRNRLLMILKNHDFDIAIAMFILSIIIYTASLFFTDYKLSKLIAQIQAYKEVLSSVPYLLSWRRVNSLYRQLSTRALVSSRKLLISTLIDRLRHGEIA
jgi:GT2 family glycosyltransferase